MTGAQANLSPAASGATGMESRLSAALRRTTGEIARLECLDEEQRAEIYAILQAIRADTEVHGELVKALEGPRARRTGA